MHLDPQHWCLPIIYFKYRHENEFQCTVYLYPNQRPCFKKKYICLKYSFTEVSHTQIYFKSTSWCSLQLSLIINGFFISDKKNLKCKATTISRSLELIPTYSISPGSRIKLKAGTYNITMNNLILQIFSST